jgi:hypothetical protein
MKKLFLIILILLACIPLFGKDNDTSYLSNSVVQKITDAHMFSFRFPNRTSEDVNVYIMSSFPFKYISDTQFYNYLSVLGNEIEDENLILPETYDQQTFSGTFCTKETIPAGDELISFTKSPYIYWFAEGETLYWDRYDFWDEGHEKHSKMYYSFPTEFAYPHNNITNHAFSFFRAGEYDNTTPPGTQVTINLDRSDAEQKGVKITFENNYYKEITLFTEFRGPTGSIRFHNYFVQPGDTRTVYVFDDNIRYGARASDGLTWHSTPADKPRGEAHVVFLRRVSKTWYFDRAEAIYQEQDFKVPFDDN